jgi:hypothetical protein
MEPVSLDPHGASVVGDLYVSSLIGPSFRFVPQHHANLERERRTFLQESDLGNAKVSFVQ